MRIVVVSDSHSRRDILAKVLKKHQGADMFIHCGDSNMSKNELKGIVAVRGNTDYAEGIPMMRTVDFAGHSAIVMHGHRFFYGLPDLEAMARFARDNQKDIVFFGHSHRYCDQVVNGVRMLNPGSLSYNKDGTPACYMILDVVGSRIDVRKMTLDTL